MKSQALSVRAVNRIPGCLLLALFWMILSVPAVSQTQNIPPPKNPDTGPQTNTDDSSGPTMRDRTKQQEENPVETLKVNVDVVNLLFNVKDKGGHLLPDLNKEEFQVIEDGKPQNIKYFKAESRTDLS